MAKKQKFNKIIGIEQVHHYSYTSSDKDTDRYSFILEDDKGRQTTQSIRDDDIQQQVIDYIENNQLPKSEQRRESFSRYHTYIHYTGTSTRKLTEAQDTAIRTMVRQEIFSEGWKSGDVIEADDGDYGNRINSKTIDALRRNGIIKVVETTRRLRNWKMSDNAGIDIYETVVRKQEILNQEKAVVKTAIADMFKARNEAEITRREKDTVAKAATRELQAKVSELDLPLSITWNVSTLFNYELEIDLEPEKRFSKRTVTVRKINSRFSKSEFQEFRVDLKNMSCLSIEKFDRLQTALKMAEELISALS